MFKKYLYLKKNMSDLSTYEDGKEGIKAPENKILSSSDSELHLGVSEISL